MKLGQGQDHDFLLLSYDEYMEMGYSASPDYASYVVSIHDDLIQYIQDTFNWVPSINPGMNYEKGYGLCNYGVTLFDKEGAKVILKLAKAWGDLFSNGPTTLRLTGNYCWSTNKQGIQESYYDILEVDRDELVEKFRKLQFLSEKVIAGDYLILHQGI